MVDETLDKVEDVKIVTDKKPTFEIVVSNPSQEDEIKFLEELEHNAGYRSFFEYSTPIKAGRLVTQFDRVGLEYNAIKSTNPNKKGDPFAFIGLYDISHKNRTAKLYYVNRVKDNEPFAKDILEIGLGWLQNEYNMRKISAYVVEPLLIDILKLSKWDVEGQLSNQIYINGEYHPITILSVEL